MLDADGVENVHRSKGEQGTVWGLLTILYLLVETDCPLQRNNCKISFNSRDFDNLPQVITILAAATAERSAASRGH